MEKFKKNYDKLVNKYIEEVKELARAFKTPKPLQLYFELGKRAFQLCSEQTKSVNKFIHNRFVLFLRILNTPKIDKTIFMEIVNSNTSNLDLEQYSEK